MEIPTLLVGMLTLLVHSHSLTSSRFVFLRNSIRLQSSTASRDTSSASSGSQLSVPSVLLKRTRQSKAFRNGSQLIYPRAISKVENAQVADLVQVLVEPQHKSGKPTSLGFGVYNSNSMYRVRVLCHRHLQPSLYQSIQSSADRMMALRLILNHHLRTAITSRRALNLPNEDTDTYRLVNGEGDQLSGLAVDIISSTAVVMSSATWCQVHRETILEALSDILPDHELVWKTTPSRLRQDGYQLNPEENSNDDASQMVLSRENGIRYQTYPYSDGQKTGVYTDQRENRLNVASLCRDKRVLDLCCYHGGFSLNAVLNGNAAFCTSVDSSQDAIDACQANAALNGCEDKLELIRSDITTFLQESFSQREYDVIILDPPKLAPSVQGLDKARRKYHSFNRDAIKLVSKDGGLLLTCTCSAAMTQKDGGQYFLGMVQGAALAAQRQVTLLRVSGAASCHTQSPISWPAGAYLTAALFYVHPSEEI